MIVTYDPSADAATIYLAKPKPNMVMESFPVENNLINGADVSLGFGRDGRLVTIEILGASRVLPLETLKGASPPGLLWKRRNRAKGSSLKRAGGR